MGLTKLALRRPVSMVIGICALVVFGVMSVFSFPMELTPEMEMPMMIVNTVYPGANPDDVEKLVTKEVEDAVATLNGVKTVTSTSSENMSLVMLQYEYGTNMDQAYSDLKEKLDTYANIFPEDVMTPVIMELDMNAQEAMTLSISGDTDENLLRIVEDEIVPELEKLSTVATVDVSGGQEEYISIELMEDRMQQYGLDMTTIANCIGTANFTLPAGTASMGDQDMSVTAGIDYDTAESLKNIPIPLGNGNQIHLSDVANVKTAMKDAESISRYNGNENISLAIQRRQSSSVVDMSNDVKKELESLRADYPGLNIAIVDDGSDMIVSSLMSVAFTLILGIVISMIILFLFFGDIKASLIVGSSMPVSLLVTFLCMKAMGFSLNIVTMSSLVIGIGMMVDNSIVVLENCFLQRSRHKQSFKDAALLGAKTVTSSIIASTITTCVVFIPIALVSGMSGQMFKPLGFTIVFSLVASLISAIMLVPLTFAFYKPKEKQNTPVTKIMAGLENFYGNVLSKILNKRKTVVAVSLLLLVGALAMVPFLNIELIPQMDEGTVEISIETKPGLNLEKVDAVLKKTESIVAKDPDVENYLLTVGSSGGMSLSSAGSTTATLTAYLKGDRSRETKTVIQEWEKATKDMTDCDLSFTSVNSMASMGTGGENEVSLNFQGSNLDALKELDQQVQDLMRSKEGILTVSSSIQEGGPIAKVQIDPVKAAGAGFTPIQIASILNSTLSGTEATTLTQNGQEYSVMVEYPAGRYESVNDLSGLTLISPTGTSVALTDLATIEFQTSPQSISRRKGQYYVEITAVTADGMAADLQKELDQEMEDYAFPQGTSLANSAMDDMIMEEFSSLGTALIVAVLLVFMVMAMQFESPRYSLMVMVCIPFSLIGSFGLMMISGCSLSMTSVLGFLLLVGTVVNNGILYVDTTNEYKKTMSVRDALILTGKTRLRPILMTTLTTILSMIPTALAIGDGGEMMQGLAIVVIGGLTASTFLTLLLLPTFYLILSGKDKKKKKAKHTLDEDWKELDSSEKEVEPLKRMQAAVDTPSSIEKTKPASLPEGGGERKEDCDET
ncbi:MAG: efflux RND transporter permease subunit [Clostridiales bacterium]|jgi:CzcA family heavy metal efflux pump|nr:efflux RND transporter permease subunit [Clostridiales bacterium]